MKDIKGATHIESKMFLIVTLVGISQIHLLALLD